MLPTSKETLRPTGMPTDVPTKQPESNEENIGIRLLDKLKGVGCKFLDTLGFKRACGKNGKAVLPKVDPNNVEDELTAEFYVQHGARVSIVGSLKTLLRLDKSGHVTARAAKKKDAAQFEIMKVGGGKLHFGSTVVLKIGSKYITSKRGMLEASSLTAGLHFTLFDPSDYSSRKPIRDFAIVALRTPKMTWVVADKMTASMRSDGPGVGTEGKLQLMKISDQ